MTVHAAIEKLVRAYKRETKEMVSAEGIEPSTY
jgi:hypothetical protein